jgi:TatD DNase family protein
MFPTIDTHSHIYLPEFDADRNETVKRALAAGVQKIYLPNVDSETIEALHQLVAEFRLRCCGRNWIGFILGQKHFCHSG